MRYVSHVTCGAELELRRVLVGPLPQADGDDGQDHYITTLFCKTCNRPVTDLEGDPVGPYVGVFKEGEA